MTTPLYVRARNSLTWTDAGAAVIVVVQLFVLATVSLAGSWYQDDLRAMSQAAAYQWSSDWLFGAGVGGTHFSPFTRAWFSVLNVLAPMNRELAVLGILVLQGAATILLWTLARRLRAAPGPALLVVALYALSPLSLAPLAWTIQAVQFLPVHLGLLIAAHAQLSYQRSGHRRWLVLAVVGLALGLSSWEKTLPGIALLLVLGPLWETRPPHSLWRWPVQRWALTSSYVALVVVYLAMWRLGGYGTGQTAGQFSGVLETVLQAWVSTIAPGLFGGPWSWAQLAPNSFFPSSDTAPLVGALATGALILAVLWSLRRVGGRRTLWVVGGFLVVTVTTVGMAAVGRGSVYGTLVGLDLRYTHDVALYAALSALTLVALSRASTRKVPAVWRRAPLLLAVGAAAIFTGTSFQGFSAIWSLNPTGNFLDTAQASVPERGRATLDSRVPDSVLNSTYFESFAYVSSILRPIRPDLPFGRLEPASGLVDNHGRYVPGRFSQLAQAPRGSEPSCRTRLSTADRTQAEFPLSEPVPHLAGLTLRIDTLSGESVPWTVEVSDGTQWRAAAPDLPAAPSQPVPWNAVPRGLIANTFLVPQMRVAAVRISVSPEGGQVVCVLDVSVGTARP